MPEIRLSPDIVGASSWLGVTVALDPRDERPLDTAAAGQAAWVAEHVIRMWRTRGWFDPQGRRKYLPIAACDDRGRPQHRYTDVLAAA